MKKQIEDLIDEVVSSQRAIVESWRVEHLEHYPGPSTIESTSPLVTTVRCSCGLTLVTEVVVLLHTRGLNKNAHA